MKTKPIQIKLPTEIWEAVKAAAAEDDRPMTLFLGRILRAHPLIVKHIPEGLRVPAPARQSAFTAPVPPGPFPSAPAGEVPSVADTYALPPVPSDVDDLPVEQWDNDRLVRTLQEKRSAAQEERARIASLQSGPEAEKAKSALERFLVLIGVIEREFMKRRGKQPKKAPEPPRANPHPKVA